MTNMLCLIRGLTILMLLAWRTAMAADLPGPWVQFASDGGLDVRAIVAPGMACPKVVADGVVVASVARGKPDADYPVQLCVARVAATARALTVDGLLVPTLPNDVRR